jgi:hypothetical protein
MLVALGDKPARRPRTATTSTATSSNQAEVGATCNTTGNAQVTPFVTDTGAQTVQAVRLQRSASVQADSVQRLQDSAHDEPTQIDAEVAQVDTGRALDLVASRATTQPVETVLAAWPHDVEGHRSTLQQRGRGSIAGPHSGLWMAPKNGGAATCKLRADAALFLERYRADTHSGAGEWARRVLSPSQIITGRKSKASIPRRTALPTICPHFAVRPHEFE